MPFSDYETDKAPQNGFQLSVCPAALSSPPLSQPSPPFIIIIQSGERPNCPEQYGQSSWRFSCLLSSGSLGGNSAFPSRQSIWSSSSLQKVVPYRFLPQLPWLTQGSEPLTMTNKFKPLVPFVTTQQKACQSQRTIYCSFQQISNPIHFTHNDPCS